MGRNGELGPDRWPIFSGPEPIRSTQIGPDPESVPRSVRSLVFWSIFQSFWCLLLHCNTARSRSRVFQAVYGLVKGAGVSAEGERAVNIFLKNNCCHHETLSHDNCNSQHFFSHELGGAWPFWSRHWVCGTYAVSEHVRYWAAGPQDAENRTWWREMGEVVGRWVNNHRLCHHRQLSWLYLLSSVS